MSDTDDEIEKHGKRFEALELKLYEHIQKCAVCQGDSPCEVGEGIAQQMDEASEAIIKLYETEQKKQGPGERRGPRPGGPGGRGPRRNDR